MAFNLSGLRLSDVFGAVNNVSPRAAGIIPVAAAAEPPSIFTTPGEDEEDKGTDTDTDTDTGDEGTYAGSPLETDEPFNPGMSFPVPGYEDAIQDDYGEPRAYRGGYHEGTDIVAPEGTDIVAPVAGEIVSIHTSTNGGNIIHLQGQDGRLYKFMHMSEFAVTAGATVTAGQTIGYVGNTGHSSTPHLHFEIHENGAPTDPHDWLMGVASGAITGATEEAAEPEIGRFENEQPTTFTAIEEWVKREAWKGEYSGFTEIIGLFVDAWGNKFYGENGRWPEPQEIISDPGFNQAAMLQPFSATFTGPNVGVVNGPEGRFFYVNDPVWGMKFNPVDGPRPGIDIAFEGQQADPSEVEFVPSPGQEGASPVPFGQPANLGGGSEGGGGGAAASGGPTPPTGPAPPLPAPDTGIVPT